MITELINKKNKKENKSKKINADFEEAITIVDLMISNIERNGIDVEKEKDEVEALRRDIKTVDNFTSLDMNAMTFLQSKTEKLMSIKSRLESYESIILILNKASFLNNAMKLGLIRTELEKYSTVAKELVSEICGISPIVNAKYKSRLESVYDILYKFIKEEITLTFKSEVLESLKNNTIVLYYLNELILKEVKEINSSTYTVNPDLIDRLNMFVNKSGLNSLTCNVVNEEVILNILLITSPKEVTEGAMFRLNNIKENYKNNLNSIKNIIYGKEKIRDTTTKTSRLNDKYNENIKELKKKAIALAISASLTIGIGINLPKIGKKTFTDYYTTTQVYEIGKEPVSITSFEKKLSQEVSRDLEVWSKSKKDGSEYTRNYSKYDLSDMVSSDETNLEFLNVDIDTYELVSYYSRNELTESIEEERRKLTIISQDFDSEKNILNKSNYKTFLLITYIVLVLSSLFMKQGAFNLLIRLFVLINNFDNINIDINNKSNLLKNFAEQAEKLIKTNKELESLYYSILNGDAKYLSEEELIDEIKALIPQNEEYNDIIKKLRRTL